MEQLDYNPLFRWFVGLEMDDPVWNATVFTKNRQRLLDGEVARAFFDRVVGQARDRGLLSDEHFTVDGTLVEARASLKSFQRKDALAPLALCTGFGDSDMTFELRAWAALYEESLEVRSELAVAVHAALTAAEIEIAVPERHIHIRNTEGEALAIARRTPGP